MSYPQYLSPCLSILTLITLALLSPGPDFAVVVKNSMANSKKYALYTALGVSLGIFFHLICISLGFGLLIVNNHELLLLLQYLGAAYLIYLGFKALQASRPSGTIRLIPNSEDSKFSSAIFSGLLTSTLNPKTLLLFSSIFSVFVSPEFPQSILFICDILIFFIAFIWFGFIAMCLSSSLLRNKFIAMSYWLQRVTGAFLVLLGLRLILTSI